jgi:uncharacterized iron-regulated protein
MKKSFKHAMLFIAACTMTTGFVACGNDENDNTLVPTTPTNNNGSTSTNDTVPTIDVNNLDFKMAYADKWANYMSIVSGLLKDDATTLYNEWNDRYADYFKAHNSDEYLSALNCVDQILDGCKEIASEVGASKIGEPYNYWVDGDREAAVYAVESWYSWHSREDYRNNIYSIRNAYYGTRDGSISPNSLSALLAKKKPELDQQAKEAIQNAADAIWDIPQPFRNNISTIETVAAMLACAELEEFIDKELKPYFNDNIKTDEELDPIVRQYVDVVVLPTYKDLMNKNIALDNAVKEFKKSPSDQTFAACADAWLAAREPWEQSEAFLFGPVDEKGLDPNMDSWPLDQAQIAQILNSQDFSNLYWNESASDSKIEEAQSLRGFHTLEFLIFKDGKARTVK